MSDIGQTEGKPLPEFEVPSLTGDANEELFGGLLTLMRKRGVTVSFESRPEMDPGIKGFFRHPDYIWVRPEEPRAQQLKTLTHEIAHYFSAGVFRIPREDAETIAESAAFVVGAHYGFATGVRSFPYVALWARDRKVLDRNLGDIRRVASIILDELSGLTASKATALLPATSGNGAYTPPSWEGPPLPGAFMKAFALTPERIALVERVNEMIRQRTRYGVRKEMVTKSPGYVLYWSNASAEWWIYGGRRAKGDMVILDANHVLIQGAKRPDLEAICKWLEPLPLYRHSFESRERGIFDLQGWLRTLLESWEQGRDDDDVN